MIVSCGYGGEQKLASCRNQFASSLSHIPHRTIPSNNNTMICRLQYSSFGLVCGAMLGGNNSTIAAQETRSGVLLPEHSQRLWGADVPIVNFLFCATSLYFSMLIWNISLEKKLK